jgi:putative glutamine amidotransferase
MHRPVIGITSSQFVDQASHGTFNRHSLSKAYSEAVHRAGGVPIILPYFEDVANEMLKLIDGLILSGGADIDPARFGDRDIHPETYDIIPERDAAEFALAAGALERDMPLLGICRGIQVLNVVMGGTLYQDVADQFRPDIAHRQQAENVPANQAGHTVNATNGSLLERVYGLTRIPVNSFHHQAVKDPAPELIVSGTADDGLIEAIESPGHRFVIGVQWHPELMYETDQSHLAPFRSLVEAGSLARVVH